MEAYCNDNKRWSRRQGEWQSNSSYEGSLAHVDENDGDKAEGDDNSSILLSFAAGVEDILWERIMMVLY